MSRRSVRFTQAEITRAVKAIIAGGMQVGEIVIAPDGSIRIIAVGQSENDVDREILEFRRKHGY